MNGRGGRANVTIPHELPPISAPVVNHDEKVPTTVQKHKEIPKEQVMKLKSAAPVSEQRKNEDLDGRYGKIGIPAVAAALPYKSDAKNPAYAPVVHRDEEWPAETAA
jgi:hypothetical protein